MDSNEELFRRLEDLRRRCEKQSVVTEGGFLTPAERLAVENRFRQSDESRIFLSGGSADCERQMVFFLPWYMESEELPLADYIRCIRIHCPFGSPGHRDYMGSVLGLGIRREWLGDIRLVEKDAYVFCQPSVAPLLLQELTHVGRCGVKTEEIPLEEVPVPERKVKRLSFTVKSMRLDAVAGEMFSLSRTSAAEAIRLGAVTLNYSVCDKTDAPVKEGDILSMRGHGKGSILEIGGLSRRERLFITAELWL